ncbi:MAG: two-component sensor histidine kinase [Oscillospiraceae bacterium]|nr:two-component sensor histidine kinase [Oscillospiraceae bacterium]
MTFTHSIRFKFILFVLAILAVLLLLLNTYPITSSRDTVFQEKQSSLSSQITVVSSALGSLDRLSQNGVNDVLRFLDLSGFNRIVVVDEHGDVVFDDGQDAPDAPDLHDLQTALTGKSVFRSVFADAAFSSSIAVPVGSRGAMIGAVSLSEVDTERAAIILSIQNRIVFLSLFIGLAALLLAAAFSWIVLRRFYSLARSMHTVAGGNYAYRHEITGNDEISDLEREFNTLTECLEENEKQRRRFVSDASHELKTPLASIRLMSDSILNTRQMDPDTMREFVSDIRTASDRLQRTTEKLLDLSRLDDGIRLIPEPVDLKQITLDVLPGLRDLAADRGVAVNARLDDGCVIMANADDISRVVFNLAENAIKYNVPGGSVEILLSQDEQTVRLTVSDTGIGIPEEDRLNIFTRFYRVDKARSRQSGGSGLGLSIVHDAVLQCGGSIDVGSNKPQGSVFVVSFPRPTSEETGI